jgi:hypothetical protein
LVAACGDQNDAEVFAEIPPITVAPSSSSTTAPPIVTTTTTTTSPSSATATTTSARSTFPDSGQVVIDFTFSAAQSTQVKNPYIAVWIETADGSFVKTVSVWFGQDRNATTWLQDLRQWFAASGVVVESGGVIVSDATRVAGTYSVLWDGTDDAGSLVPHGDYVVFVEAARENGPYAITSAGFAVTNAPFQVIIPDNGELVGLSATMTV